MHYSTKWYRIYLQHRRWQFDPWIGKIPWSGKWKPTLIFLPEKFNGQRSLMGYSTKDHKESDTTEQLSTHASLFNIFFLGFS